MKTFRLWPLSVIILGVSLFTSGLVWQGYAGLEGGPTREQAIKRPFLRGTLVAIFAPATPPLDPSCPASCPPSCPLFCLELPPRAVFSFAGQCRGSGPDQPVELGPLIADEFPRSFFQPEYLEGAFFSDDLLGDPPACFAESGVEPRFIFGYMVTKVRRFSVLTQSVVIAEVELSAVH
jgi:hypothetical protein